MPRSTANIVPLIALRWPSMRARIVCRKLGFLQRIFRNDLSYSVIRAMAAENVWESLIVKECLELEKPFQTRHTKEVITAGLLGERVEDPSRNIKKKDWENTMSEADKHPSIIHLTNFVRQENSWMRIWDDALDRGAVGTSRALAVLRLLSAPVYGDRRCILSCCHSPVENMDTMLDHFLKIHQDVIPFIDPDTLIDRFSSEPDSLFDLGQALLLAMQ